MLSVELFEQLQELLALKSSIAIDHIRKLKIQINEYEQHFLWVIDQILSRFYCNSSTHIPFAWLEESFKNSEIIEDLSVIKALQTDLEFAAKINDCFWIHKHDYESACKAYNLYTRLVKISSDFETANDYLFRLLSITILTKNDSFKMELAEKSIESWNLVAMLIILGHILL